MTATAPGTETAPNTGSVYDNRFTRAFGAPKERTQQKIKGQLTEVVASFIQRSPFLVMATADAAGRCDASPKGGAPGFVRILDERHLLLPDVAGNKLFQGYLNVEQTGQVGLLFMIPGDEQTVRVNGRATILSGDEVRRHVAQLEVQFQDDNTILLQGLLIEVEEAYTHCPRAFKFADLWNPETIAANRP
jgi:uncharacterized protein